MKNKLSTSQKSDQKLRTNGSQQFISSNTQNFSLTQQYQGMLNQNHTNGISSLSVSSSQNIKPRNSVQKKDVFQMNPQKYMKNQNTHYSSNSYANNSNVSNNYQNQPNVLNAYKNELPSQKYSNPNSQGGAGSLQQNYALRTNKSLEQNSYIETKQDDREMGKISEIKNEEEKQIYSNSANHIHIKKQIYKSPIRDDKEQESNSNTHRKKEDQQSKNFTQPQVETSDENRLLKMVEQRNISKSVPQGALNQRGSINIYKKLNQAQEKPVTPKHPRTPLEGGFRHEDLNNNTKSYQNIIKIAGNRASYNQASVLPVINTKGNNKNNDISLVKKQANYSNKTKAVSMMQNLSPKK